jgi:signal transduction histidine kinase
LHGDAPQARERALDVIEHGLMQIRTTVAALLPQARVQDRPLEPSDFDDVLTLARPAAQAQGVSLSARSEVESALRVPSAPVRQAMLNMLLNAIKAAGPGGRVAVQLLADAEQVRFCVTNSGTALDPQRFAATLAQEGGDDPRGFGIWVCQQIANHHRGGFTLDPDYRDGTRLVFWLPNREID